MTKLQNSLESLNLKLKPEFSEYLLQNDFSSTSVKDTIKFCKSDRLLVVRENTIDFYKYNPELEGDESLKWIFQSSFTGIDKIDTFGWMLLMHTMKVLTVGQFMCNMKRKDPQLHTESKFMVRSIIHSFENTTTCKEELVEKL